MPLSHPETTASLPADRMAEASESMSFARFKWIVPWVFLRQASISAP